MGKLTAVVADLRRWQGTTPDMSTLYLAAMDALYEVSPTTLFFVEGGGQLPYSMCWGDGFVTDKSIIAANGLSDPNDFFTTLLAKPYLNNVVISPHYYPPSISQAKTGCALFMLLHLDHVFDCFTRATHCFSLAGSCLSGEVLCGN